MSETNIHRMFNNDANIMQNHNNITALLLQLLVQNYIEHRHKSKNSYVYSEAVNDIDIFNKDIHTIDIIRDGLCANIKLGTFIDILPDNCYTHSYEVKTGKLSYILQFKNLLQLITKTRYQPTTKLGLILIPYRTDIDIDELKNKYKLFDKLKTDLLNKPLSTQRQIFNTLVNKTFLFNANILDAFIHVIGMENNGKLKPTYETLRGMTKRRDRIAKNIAVIIKCLTQLKYCDADIMELKNLVKNLNKILGEVKEEELLYSLDSINKIIHDIDNNLNDIRVNIFAKYDNKGMEEIVNLINESCKKITREVNNNKDISKEQFTILRNNLINTQIEIISVDELMKYNITTSYILNIIKTLDK